MPYKSDAKLQINCKKAVFFRRKLVNFFVIPKIMSTFAPQSVRNNNDKYKKQ